MSRFQKILLWAIVAMLGVMVYAEATKPKPVDWFPSFTKLDKRPFGTFVLFDLLSDSFGDSLEVVNIPPYEKLQDSTFTGTYLFINNRINFDDTELNKMLDWVATGNTVFISANEFGYNLKDTLQLETENEVLYDRISTEPMVNLVNERLKAQKPYHLQRDLILKYFEEIDTLSQRVLGVAQAYRDTLKIDKPLVNFIKAPFGTGNFYLHTQPEVFTNYFLLEEANANYSENALSYINTGSTVYWDSYYKTGKRVNASPLYLLLNNKYLKWAYYMLLIGTLLFVFFQGKRKQRSIPIVQPLTNKTYEYTQTISGMYLDKKENHEIAKKQIILLFEFVRTRLRVPTEHINERFFVAVAARSGNTVEDTKNLFTFIEKVQNQHTTGEAELVQLYTDITTFKEKIDGKS